MTVQVYTAASTSHTYTNVQTAAITDEGVVSCIYTDSNDARHSVQEQTDFQIVITKAEKT